MFGLHTYAHEIDYSFWGSYLCTRLILAAGNLAAYLTV